MLQGLMDDPDCPPVSLYWGMAIGFALSSTLVKRVQARLVRRAVLFVSAASALILLAQNG